MRFACALYENMVVKKKLMYIYKDMLEMESIHV